jgi:hypothetical protein
MLEGVCFTFEIAMIPATLLLNHSFGLLAFFLFDKLFLFKQ